MSHTGKFIWNELMTRDVEQSKAFLRKAYGWTFSSMPGANGITYWVCENNGEGIGGIFEMKGTMFDGVAERWVPYVMVDDVDATYKVSVDAGAKVHREPFDIPNVGRIAIYDLPGGAMIGILKPNPKQG